MRAWRNVLIRLTSVGMILALVSTFHFAATAAAQEEATVMMQQVPGYGTILTDPDGYALYTWDADEEGVSHCYGACADAWPPYTIDGDLIPPDGLNMSLGLIQRDDGEWQVTLDNWPLYYFIRDVSPGDVNGDGNGGFGATWYVAAVVTTPPLVFAPPSPPSLPQPSIAAAPPPPPPPARTATPIPAAAAQAFQATPGPSGGQSSPNGAQYGSQYGSPQGPYGGGPFGPGLPPPPPPPLPPPPPPVVPVGGLSATTSTIAAPDGTATLTWAPSPAATSYRIYEGAAAGPTSLTLVQTVNTLVPTAATIGGLTPGSAYLFEVRGVDPAGIERVVPSTATSTAPIVGILPPPVLTLGGTTSTTATLTWVPVPGAMTYTVLMSNSLGGPFAPTAVSSVTGTSSIVTGLRPITSYFFQVVANDQLGRPSPPSNIAVALTPP